jgi:hypothetical protein
MTIFLRFLKHRDTTRSERIGILSLLGFGLIISYAVAYKAYDETKSNQATLAQSAATDAALRFGDGLLKGGSFTPPDTIKQPVKGMKIALNWYPRSKVYTLMLSGYQPGTCEYVLLMGGAATRKIAVSGYDKEIPIDAVHDVCQDKTGTITITGQG